MCAGDFPVEVLQLHHISACAATPALGDAPVKRLLAPGTEDSLIVLCANCHVLIHRHPDVLQERYPQATRRIVARYGRECVLSGVVLSEDSSDV